MKTFGELTKEQRETALMRAKDLLVAHIVEGVIEVEMQNTVVQRDFDMILSDARRTENMSLAKDMLVRHAAINKKLTEISQAAAFGSRYNVDGGFLMDNQ